jgi:HEAT repeat protein
MSITFICPKCHNIVVVEDHLAGQISRCPTCSTAFRIPTVAANPAKPPSPVPSPCTPAPKEQAIPPKKDPAVNRPSCPAPARAAMPTAKKTSSSQLPSSPSAPPVSSLPVPPQHSRHSTLLGGLLGGAAVGLIGLLIMGAGLAWWFSHRTPNDALQPAANRTEQVSNESTAPNEPKQTKEEEGPTIGNTLSGEQIYERTLKSTVWILKIFLGRIVDCGSGALVDREEKLVITNYHVVGEENAATIFAIFFPYYQQGKTLVTSPSYYVEHRNDLEIRGRVVAREPSKDLALLQLDRLPKDVPVLKLATKSAKPGQNVHSIGASGVGLGTLWRYTTGQVRQVYKRSFPLLYYGVVNAWVVETSAPINPGDSGGPVVNDQARLIAVVESYEPQRQRLVSTNIDVREIRRLLIDYMQSIGKKWEESNEPDLSDPNRLLALINKLKHPDAVQRAAAARALGELASAAQPAIPALIRAWDDSDEVVRQHVAAALEKIGPPALHDAPLLITLLQDRRRERRRYAARMLAQMDALDATAYPAVIKAVNDEDVEVRRRALEALSRWVGKDEALIIPVLVRALKDPAAACRLQAAQGLEQAGRAAKSAAFAALLQALRDNAKEVQQAALKALFALGPPEEADLPLLDECFTDPSALVRWFAIWALESLGPKAASRIDVLGNGLRDADPEVRHMAAEVLGNLGPHAKAALPALVHALQDPESASLRRLAALALGRLGHEKGVLAALTSALDDKDGEVRSAVEAALKNLAPFDKRDVDDLIVALQNTSERTRAFALETLAQIGADAGAAVPQLQLLLKAPSLRERLRTVDVLAAIGPDAREAVTALAEALNDKEIPPAEKGPNMVQDAVDSKRVFRDLLKSTVWIRWSLGHGGGSGWVVDVPLRLVVTDASVVGDQKQVIVFFPKYTEKGELISSIPAYEQNEQQGIRADVLPFRDKKCILALLKLKQLPLEAQALALAPKSAEPGETVHAVGTEAINPPFSEGKLWQYTSGKVKQISHARYPIWLPSPQLRRPSFITSMATVLVTHPVLSTGDSGGPVVNDRLELVAVTSYLKKTSLTPLGGRRGIIELERASTDVLEVRAFLKEAFRAFGKRWQSSIATNAVVVQINESNYRLAIARALAKIGPDAAPAIPALCKALYHPNVDVKKQVAETLGAIGPAANTAVGDLLNASVATDCQKAVAEAIGKIGVAAVPRLIKALEDFSPQIRLTAVMALEQIGPDAKEAIQPLKWRFAKDRREIREAAAKALRKIDQSD